MSPRSIRRAAERKAEKLVRKNTAVTNNSSEPSEARLAANRANAQLSSGPKTLEGKANSSLNAVKTGLTGRTVLLPSDEAAHYEQHLRDYFEEFHPAGPRETELVQSIADTAWRLRRIPELEMGIYALDHSEQLAEHAAAGNDAPDTSVFELQTFLKYEKQLRNLQLQESRLRRHREKDIAELRTLQAERRATNEKQNDENEEEAQTKTVPAGQPRKNGFLKDGFVFSNRDHLDKMLESLDFGDGHLPRPASLDRLAAA